MPVLDRRPFRAQPNTVVMNAIRAISTDDYQRRIPEVTKANIHETVRDLMNYAPARNEFINGFINKVGMELARRNSWNNPLAEFKLGLMGFGESIEEYMVGLVQAKTYDPTRSSLEAEIFGAETPDVQVNYHKINRQEYYKITVNQAMLQRAFTSEMGLSQLISSLMEAPATSDNWDEYLLTCSLFREYDVNNGYFRVNVPNVIEDGSDVIDAKTALRRIRAMVGNLSFISPHYNAAKMPTSAQPEDLMLLASPEFQAAIDVEALAAAFNIEKAAVPSRIVTVRQEDFGIEGAQAILTTKDFFVIADTLIENRSQSNPVGLYDNYFFHHHSVISVSRFVPAVLFTTGPGTVIEPVETPVASIGDVTIYDANGDEHTGPLEVGAFYQLAVNGVTTPAGGLNDAVALDWTGTTSPRSQLWNTGSLYLAMDETATSIEVVITSVDDPTITSTETLTVDPAGVEIWPVPTPGDGEATPPEEGDPETP